MGAGAAFLGPGLQSAVGGYWSGKQQVTAERHQQAQDLYMLADRYSKLASQYQDSDPSMYNLMWKAASESAGKADKLIGEKGQGAWKAVRPLFAKFVPALQDPAKDNPHQEAMAGRAFPGSQAPPIGGAPQQQMAPVQGPPDYSAMAAANPPATPDMLRDRAAKAVGSFIDQYKTLEDFHSDPQGGEKMLIASVQGAKLGVDAGKMLEQKLKPLEPMMTFDESSPYYKAINAKAPFSMPITQAMELMRAMPDATKNLQNQWATLVQAQSDGTATPQQLVQYKKLLPIMKPDNVTEIEAIIGDTPPGSPEAIQKLVNYHKQISRMQRDLNPGNTLRTQMQVDATTGQAFNFIFDESTGKSTVKPYVDAAGKPIFLAKNAAAAAYITARHDAQGGVTYLFNANNIRRDLANGNLSPQEAADQISVLPDTITEGLAGTPKPNPAKQMLIKWINSAAAGTLKDEGFTPIPEITLPKPDEGQSGPGFFSNLMGKFGFGGTPKAGPPTFSDADLDRLFPPVPQ